jgi:hypothetical protein
MHAWFGVGLLAMVSKDKEIDARGSEWQLPKPR